MLAPIDAFSRLKKDGEFIERVDDKEIFWYWHLVGGGHRIMARRYLTDGTNAPTLYREFFISEPNPLTPKRYF